MATARSLFPLKLLIGASNELPAAGEGLEALLDRFLVRMVIGPVRSEASFRQLVGCDGEPETAPGLVYVREIPLN